MNKGEIEKITGMLECGDTDEALSACMSGLSKEGNAEDFMFWFLYGKTLWKLGRIPQATTAFRRSMELNPDSPAKVALEMSDDISEFFNPDLLNP